MNEILKICGKHGDLFKEQVYFEKASNSSTGFRAKCKQCKLDKDLRYREKNRKYLSEKNIEYKKNNRDIVNAWNRMDRSRNREKYLKYEKAYITKHGKDFLNKRENARLHGLTIEEYEEWLNKNNGLCMACNKPEKRVGRDGITLTPLCMDHCHDCDEKGKHVIRGVLCHACNSSLGKLKDNIDTLKNLITYLENHKHVE